jgi:hypothetical protein
MFANIILAVLNFAFPDVCKVPTPVGPVPLPLPNFALTGTHVPAQLHVIIGGGLAENLLSEGTLSLGDTPGVLLGVVSETVMAGDRYLLGSLKVCFGPAFAQRLTSLTLANMGNIPGMTIVPNQFVVIVLS